jgi:hypothetical protein
MGYAGAQLTRQVSAQVWARQCRVNSRKDAALSFQPHLAELDAKNDVVATADQKPAQRGRTTGGQAQIRDHIIDHAGAVGFHGDPVTATPAPQH